MTHGAFEDLTVPLAYALERERFGDKTARLAVALGAGLPVPPGFALSTAFVGAVLRGEPRALQALFEQADGDQPFAVRSSAVDEDAPDAPFAGIHTSRLGVRGGEALVAAVREVASSCEHEAALTYRRALSVETTPGMAVLVQTLLSPRAAGTLVTIDPVTGADVLVIEAALGLGVAVTGGELVPDRFRLSREGLIVDRVVVEKAFARVPSTQLPVQDAERGTVQGGERGTLQGTTLTPLSAELASAPSVDDEGLLRLAVLARACEHLFGRRLSLEWAMGAQGGVYLLQVRPLG